MPTRQNAPRVPSESGKKVALECPPSVILTQPLLEPQRLKRIALGGANRRDKRGAGGSGAEQHGDSREGDPVVGRDPLHLGSDESHQPPLNRASRVIVSG